jgi:hypothetical protein
VSDTVHAGKTYRRLMARVTEEARVRMEDHGLILVTLGFQHETGSQEIAPCFSPKRQNELAAAMHVFLRLRAFPKGWTGYVLQEDGLIRGLEALELDGSKIVMLHDMILECEALP